MSKLKEAARLIKKSKKTICLTGAGISVPSGIPDFRSPGGIWEKFNPLEVATAEAIRYSPRKVWEFIVETHLILIKAKPNEAHFTLTKLEKKNLLAGIITQNIDSLHQLAGSENIVEYHGNFREFYCMSCKKKYGLKDLFTSNKPIIIPPRCECEGIIRPNVVFFGENIPIKAISKTRKFINDAELILIIGTSGEVAPASLIPRQIKDQGGKIIEINLGKSSFGTLSDLKFTESADIVLPEILKTIDSHA